MLAPAAALSLSWHRKSAESFARVLRTISSEARRAARSPADSRDEAVHDLRLLVKRSRALAWFARPVLTKSLQAKIKVGLRTTSELLSGQRDRKATETTLRKISDQANGGHARRAVRRTKRAVSRGGLSAPPARTLPEAGHVLVAVLEKFARSVDAASVWPSSARRTAKAFRVMRKAQKKAKKKGREADFHAWRKKAKRLLYLLELREGDPSGDQKQLQKRVNKLQSILGNAHDCAVTLADLPQAHARRADARIVDRLLRRRKKRLRKKAGKAARRVDRAAD